MMSIDAQLRALQEQVKKRLEAVMEEGDRRAGAALHQAGKDLPDLIARFTHIQESIREFLPPSA